MFIGKDCRETSKKHCLQLVISKITDRMERILERSREKLVEKSQVLE